MIPLFVVCQVCMLLYPLYVPIFVSFVDCVNYMSLYDPIVVCDYYCMILLFVRMLVSVFC